MKITLPSHLSDHDLMTAVPTLVGREHEATAHLIAHLAEVDVRELHVPAGFSSLFMYCHEGLGFSEDAAYNRKTAAQVARRYPEIVDMLADGRLSLTAVRVLAPVLTDANHSEAFAAATGKSKREVEKVAALLEPKPDVPPSVRKLPAKAVAAVPERESAPFVSSGTVVPVGGEPTRSGPTAAQAAASGRRPIVVPLAAERYRVQFTIGETERKLRQLQELLKREIPNGDPALIFDRALTLLLEKVEGRKRGVTSKPKAANAGRPGSRHMPAGVRREVVRRDAGHCAFVGGDGRRCTERAYVEYHHTRVPFAHGGEAMVENIKLHCRTHNAYEGKRIFGPYLPPEVREARARNDDARFGVPERSEAVRGMQAPAVPERQTCHQAYV
jgi:hypothetical protein